MRAVVCTNAELEVIERPEPVPGHGQVLIQVQRCGICGSDLHARHGCDAWADMAARAGYHRFARSGEPIVFGHEFCGEVAVHGPGCRRTTPTGTQVEIDLRFVLAYSPLEFRDTLHMLAEGDIDPSPLITGTVGLDGVDAAFTALGDPEAHAKILIDPRSTAAPASLGQTALPTR